MPLASDDADRDRLVATKLVIPAGRRTLVSRPRLLDRLDEGLATPVTGVAAPAGFGKSTLVAEWAHHLDAPVAWLSLDAADNAPARFVRYLVAAFETAQPGLGEAPREALKEASAAPLDAVLAALLNALVAVPRDVVLVLDDYHVVEAQPIHAALAAFVARLPPRAHLVIASGRSRAVMERQRMSKLMTAPPPDAPYPPGDRATLKPGSVPIVEGRQLS